MIKEMKVSEKKQITVLADGTWHLYFGGNYDTLSKCYWVKYRRVLDMDDNAPTNKFSRCPVYFHGRIFCEY